MSLSEYSNHGLSSVIEKLYLDETSADVHFVIELGSGQSERIPAHKVLLCARSEAFRAMFSGSWKEQNDVEIVDLSPAEFKEFLQFFYRKEIELTAENVKGVLSLGQKYLITDCVKLCAQFMIDHLTKENVCSAYGFCHLVGHEELAKLCEVFISINAASVFETEEFLNCDRTILSRILKLDSLSCSEVHVFIATMNWVKTASKRKTLDKETVMAHLSDTFYDIRFGSMTVDELNGIFASYANVFTIEMRSEISQIIQSTNTNVVKRPRECQWDKNDVIECKRTTKLTDWGEGDKYPYNIGDETTTFVTNKPLLLRAILCGKVQEFVKFKYLTPVEEDIEGKLSIYEYRGELRDDMKPTCLVHTQKVSVSEAIQLTKPVIIKTGMKYKVCLDSVRSICYPFCTDFCFKDSEVKVKNKGIIVKFSEDAMHKGTKRSLIRGLHFNDI